MKKTIIISLILISGCGSNNTQTLVVQPTSIPETEVQQLVDSENVYREGLGQAALTQGLSCTVQLVSSGQWLLATSPGYNAGQGVVVLTGTSYSYLLQTSFNQPNSSTGVSNAIPNSIQTVFLNQNYKLNCTGQLVITDTGYYNFDVNSDDGSIVTIDGAQVVNNDGNHGMTDKSGSKYLRQGVHTFNILYAQTGGGSFGLILQSNNNIIDGSLFYH